MSLFDHLLLGAKVEGSGSSAHADGRKYAFSRSPALVVVFAIAAAEGGGSKPGLGAGPRRSGARFIHYGGDSGNLTDRGYGGR